MLLHSWADGLASWVSEQPVRQLESEPERLGLVQVQLLRVLVQLLRVLVQRHLCEDGQASSFPEAAEQLRERYNRWELTLRARIASSKALQQRRLLERLSTGDCVCVECERDGCEFKKHVNAVSESPFSGCNSRAESRLSMTYPRFFGDCEAGGAGAGAGGSTAAAAASCSAASLLVSSGLTRADSGMSSAATRPSAKARWTRS